MTDRFPAPQGPPVVGDLGDGQHRPAAVTPARSGATAARYVERRTSLSAPIHQVPAGDGPGNLAPPAASPRGLRFMGQGTLSRQLVLRVTGLVALVAITLSTVTTVSLYRILEAQLDTQLASAASRIEKVGRPNDDDRRACGGDDRGGPGQQQGLLIACSALDAGSYGSLPASGRVQLGSESERLSAEQLNQVLALDTHDQAVTVRVDDLGTYRVLTTKDQLDRTVVVGLPISTVADPLFQLLTAAVGLTLGAIALAFLAARSVVQNSLRPLQRLATTAHQVSLLELDTGEVNVPVRVPDSDTDPRSEVGQVSLAFNHMLDNVEGALESRQRSETRVRQFVADASHELRNPLASIRGYAELTRRERDAVPPTTGHALARIESESNRMSALVEDMLLLARLDSGPNYLTLCPVPLNELVGNAVSDAQVAGPDHEWELSLPHTEVVALGDAFRLHQVVANLLANARTHTPPGTDVRTTLSSSGGVAVITVADNGPGIPPAIRDKVFERFTRADASRVRSGMGQSTGLGLAIVSAVVSAHHGSATVSSGDEGTTFTIRIPLATT